MLFGLGLFLLAVMVAPPPSHSSGSAPVRVTNTPLPVQGTVGVNNFPANQTVSGTVNVGNFPSASSVQLSNAASSPVPIRDVDSSGQFYFGADCFMYETDVNCVLLNVPSTANAVIETISFDFFTDQPPTGTPALLDLHTTTAGKGFDWALLPTFRERAKTVYFYAVSVAPVKIYADAGSQVLLAPGSINGTFSAHLTITGHYVCTNNQATC
jgi:hypothetical protein